MSMQQMMDFVQKWQNIDFSKVPLDKAKDIAAQSAGRMGATYNQSVVMIKHIFG